VPQRASSDAACPSRAEDVASPTRVVQAGVVQAGVVQAGVVQAGVVQAGVVQARVAPARYTSSHRMP
jgi:hypothetical protein